MTSCSQVEGPQIFEQDGKGGEGGGEGGGGGGEGGGGGRGGGGSSAQQPVQSQPALTNALHVNSGNALPSWPHVEGPQGWLHMEASNASWRVDVVALIEA